MGYLKIAITEKVLAKKFCSFLFWVPEIPKNNWVKIISLANWPDPDNPSRGGRPRDGKNTDIGTKLGWQSSGIRDKARQDTKSSSNLSNH